MSSEWFAIVIICSLQVSCAKSSKKVGPPPRVATPAEPTTAAATPPTVEQVANLFQVASSCGTNPCPELGEIRALMKAHPDLVAMGALAVMDDPDVHQGQGVGLSVTMYLDHWFRLGPSETAKHAVAQGLEHVVNHGGEPMRGWAMVTLAEHKFPSAKRILIAEIENLAQPAGDRLGAGKTLGSITDDFEFIRGWLTGNNPAHWLGALGMIWTFEPEGNDDARLAMERDLLVALGKRSNLPGEVVEELAHFYGLYLREVNPYDADIIALATRWSKHPDPAAAYEMEKILGWYANKPKRQPTP